MDSNPGTITLLRAPQPDTSTRQPAPDTSCFYRRQVWSCTFVLSAADSLLKLWFSFVYFMISTYVYTSPTIPFVSHQSVSFQS